MLKKLMIVILAGMIFWGFFASGILAGSPGKITPERIPLNQIVPSSPMPSTDGKGPCLIQSDNDNPTWFYPSFQSGDGFALYMDPAKCGLPDPYPFKVTDVHFYLYEAGSTWPVQIQVNIRDLFTQGNKCDGPGTLLCSQTYTIPIDSASILIHLDLDSLCCVYAPFFLEIIYTGQTSPPYPSLLMTDEGDPPATCDAWVWYFYETQHWYFEWSNFWAPPPPGYPIMRITGYTQQCHPESCWYWKEDRPNQEFPAPSGMPDFDQHQFGPPDSQALCGPTAVANCLWWYDAVPYGVTPDGLIRLLSTYFHTDPDSQGTFVDSIRVGLNRYFHDYGFSLYAHSFTKPGFYEMEDSLKRSQDIILLLGFWQQPPTEGVTWFRFGGHYLTMAGVCSDSQKVALSDPFGDLAEMGGPGRVRPPGHQHDPEHYYILHNDPQYVSHDMFQAILESPSPGGLWSLPWYFDKAIPFQGQNFQPDQWQYYNPYIPTAPIYSEVEYAIMICPSCWYWKPDRPEQRHPAPSGMPDFGQYQFGPPGSLAFCGPTAVANCLWWFDAVPPGIDNPHDFILLLAQYFKTNPTNGTDVDSIQVGLDSLFKTYTLNFYEKTFFKPTFQDMEDSLKISQDIILLIGFWQELPPGGWYRIGGHFVTMAGVCSESLQVAFSDPARDAAEHGWPGGVLPFAHPPHVDGDAIHNMPQFISHDIYQAAQPSPSPGGVWWLPDYDSSINVVSFQGQNFKSDQQQFYHTYDPGFPVSAEVEYAIMICPKPTAVEEEEEGAITPKDFELYQSYPNPFNSSTLIRYAVHGSQFTVHRPVPITLKIYNILGQMVRTLVDEPKIAGNYEVVWDGKDEKGRDLASGIYFYQLKVRRIHGTGEFTQTKRMVLLK
jgi:hypothetical protein